MENKLFVLYIPKANHCIERILQSIIKAFSFPDSYRTEKGNIPAAPQVQIKSHFLKKGLLDTYNS